MTANITCSAPFQGLATSLDTLCAQAYGSGHKHLVGLQIQRMISFLMLLFLPLIVLWMYSTELLAMMIPEYRSAELAGMYLKVYLLGVPAFIVFEGGKRFVQAQGLFQATTYVLLIAAPLNAFMNWFFVWHLGLGFIGAPISVVITQNLLPTLLFLYVYFVDGKQCWGGFSKRALTNWGKSPNNALTNKIMLTPNPIRPDDPPLDSRYDHGRSRMVCLRDPDPRDWPIRFDIPSRSVHPNYDHIHHLPDPLPHCYRSVHACGKPHRRRFGRRLKDVRKGGLLGWLPCRCL